MKRESRQFISMAVGAAFGLGGVLRFPALCLSYGGAFVAAYAAMLALFAFPLLTAELALGKHSRRALPLASLGRSGGAAGAISAANSAAVCACYGVIIAALALRACTFHADVNYGYIEDMSGLLPLVACLVMMALAFFLRAGAALRSRIAGCAVALQAAAFFMLAARGLCYSNAPSVLAEVMAFYPRALLSPKLWISAAGQALLSLSVAAGVMPALASEMPPSLGPARAAGVICLCNLSGGLLSAVATLTLAGGGGCLSLISESPLISALTLYPEALRHAFSDGNICGLFGCIFFISLTLTAFVSALSLARPAYVLLCSAMSSRPAAAVLSAALFLCCLPFACGLSFAPLDRLCCDVIYPALAVFEAALILRRALTGRSRGDIILVWKSSKR